MELNKIPYTVDYRKIRYPRLEFKTGELNLFLPFGENPEKLIAKHMRWITKKRKFIDDCIKESASKKLIDRTDKEFRRLVNLLTRGVAKELKVRFNEIYFRKMKSRWASLSSKRNMTVNMFMKYLPEALIKYVIFHEANHFMEKRHNNRFWGLIAKKYPNHKDMEKSLFTYWFLVNKKEV